MIAALSGVSVISGGFLLLARAAIADIGMVFGTAGRVTERGRNILAPGRHLAARFWADVTVRTHVAATISLLKKAVLLRFPRIVLVGRV
jgi:hypothetical protein